MNEYADDEMEDCDIQYPEVLQERTVFLANGETWRVTLYEIEGYERWSVRQPVIYTCWDGDDIPF